MNYACEFKEYWEKKGRYLTVPNKTRIYNTFNKLYKKVQDKYDIFDIVEKYIKDYNAIHMKRVQLDFYSYLERKGTNLKSSSTLEEVDWKSPLERQIDILKNSHGIFKISELEKVYKLDNKTIRNDIEAIKKGIYFMDTQIKPEVNRKGTRRDYVDTVHPIFLALNLSEVNALMKFLPELLEKYKDKSESNIEKSQLKLILGLITRMKIQLSDYAIEELGIDIDFSNKELRFVSEKDVINNINDLIYLVKASDNKRKITVNNVDEYIGYIKFSNDNECKCIIKTEDGEEIKVLNADTIALKDDYK